MTSLGVNFRAKTRAELELLAKGRNRTVNWCIRSAVEAQLVVDHAELQQYAILYPELAAKITALTEGKDWAS
jgi:predicted transcriptional regulator